MDIAKFCNRKKVGLSINSLISEAVAKKQHEESLNDSMGLDKYNAFAQILNSLKCLKLLFNCLLNLKTEMKNVKEIFLAVR